MLQAKRYFEELYFLGSRSRGRPEDAGFAHPWVAPRASDPAEETQRDVGTV